GGRAQRRPHPVGHRVGREAGAAAAAAGVEIGQEDGELVAAQAGDGGRVLDGVDEPAGGLDHERVAGRVAEAVVHELEVVQVDEEHRGAAPCALRAVDGLAHALLEHGPVGQAGERVVLGDVGELLLDAAVGGHIEQVALAARPAGVPVVHDGRLVEHPNNAPINTQDPVLGGKQGAVNGNHGQLAEHALTV